MEPKPLPHIDERLGYVAVDMGLMNKDQVADVNMRVVMANAVAEATGDERATFGQVALEAGYLSKENLEALRKEERRRRRLITGYEIIKLIGKGTIATVYHARQLSVDRDVALKILHPRLASDPVFVQAYIAEAQAVSQFHHPNIVQGFDAGESNGFFYFAHEYLSGGSLADHLRKSPDGAPNFSESRLLSYLRQTTSALSHAWTVAVYHGDINPGNLLLDGQGNIKLANLGVPRVAGMGVSDKQGVVPGFVRCGPEYAAPEQLGRPDLVNSRTDIYSLGATFYHISFGVPPFAAPEGTAMIDFRKNNPMPSFSLKAQEGFSGKYMRLIHDMLETDPSKRPANPEELADRLEKFHVAGGDELGTLARQVRQVTAPASSSSRMSARTVRAASAPVTSGTERRFSLKRRADDARSSRLGWWLATAVLLIAATVLGFLFLK